MICETTWDEPPEAVVFKGRHDWPPHVRDEQPETRHEA